MQLKPWLETPSQRHLLDDFSDDESVDIDFTAESNLIIPDITSKTVIVLPQSLHNLPLLLNLSPVSQLTLYVKSIARSVTINYNSPIYCSNETSFIFLPVHQIPVEAIKFIVSKLLQASSGASLIISVSPIDDIDADNLQYLATSAATTPDLTQLAPPSYISGILAGLLDTCEYNNIPHIALTIQSNGIPGHEVYSIESISALVTALNKISNNSFIFNASDYHSVFTSSNMYL
ncbi:hypothetical protein CANCADRAFT_2003 [Tortispora caseinolytica NRRL Y-17796]|uniref:Proteasome assembly chaperone 1 n=1 Tax=Tortispora caseinolytica NRRL Y-17796 TaxID=767744 RepID=A0A1E4TES8_9ASCO|nr:hypothetical protein CANCADRAFT_2003 [Tortispora caseinolytica NRRL Y-17796]